MTYCFVPQLNRNYRIDFIYGSRNENPDLSYTQEITISGKKVRCRFCRCVITDVTSDAMGGSFYVGDSFCNPSDQFVKRTGRILSLNRAIEAMNIPKNSNSEIIKRILRVYGMGDLKAIEKLNKKFNIHKENEVLAI